MIPCITIGSYIQCICLTENDEKCCMQASHWSLFIFNHLSFQGHYNGMPLGVISNTFNDEARRSTFSKGIDNLQERRKGFERGCI